MEQIVKYDRATELDSVGVARPKTVEWTVTLLSF